MTEAVAPRRRPKVALVVATVVVAALGIIVAVMAMTGSGWFTKRPVMHQVELRVQSSTDFKVIYRYITAEGNQISVEEHASKNFAAEFESAPSSLQFSVSMPQGTANSGDLRCSVYVDGELDTTKFNDAGWVNCDSSIGES
ncbi:hypothetical protein [Leucobacter komagatae]|uniref:MmpS family membrane protein n=1 Tax=Leucobacter komagatae TaxID=55969 RepID=A0A0D0H452_9MICO|nr:hypothetical protein [Leucobacter komagatae]KIP51930.1 hypothetical protein SD72_12430 [Leucobacter komagatae]